MTVAFEQGNRRIIEQDGKFIPQRGFVLSITPHAPTTYAWEACETHRDTTAAYLTWKPKSFKTLKGAQRYILMH